MRIHIGLLNYMYGNILYIYIRIYIYIYIITYIYIYVYINIIYSVYSFRL